MPLSENQQHLPPVQCFSCAVLTGEAQVPGGGPIWMNEFVMINHHEDPLDNEMHSESRSGWFLICPIRHVTRIYDLTDQEWEAIGEAARSVDAALTQLFASKRTLLASLGWFTNDHIHFHCVPTFGQEVSFGSLNFDGAYTPVSLPSAQVAVKVGEVLRTTLPVRGKA